MYIYFFSLTITCSITSSVRLKTFLFFLLSGPRPRGHARLTLNAMLKLTTNPNYSAFEIQDKEPKLLPASASTTLEVVFWTFSKATAVSSGKMCPFWHHKEVLSSNYLLEHRLSEKWSSQKTCRMDFLFTDQLHQIWIRVASASNSAWTSCIWRLHRSGSFMAQHISEPHAGRLSLRRRPRWQWVGQPSVSETRVEVLTSGLLTSVSASAGMFWAAELMWRIDTLRVKVTVVQQREE